MHEIWKYIEKHIDKYCQKKKLKTSSKIFTIQTICVSKRSVTIKNGCCLMQHKSNVLQNEHTYISSQSLNYSSATMRTNHQPPPAAVVADLLSTFRRDSLHRSCLILRSHLIVCYFLLLLNCVLRLTH